MKSLLALLVCPVMLVGAQASAQSLNINSGGIRFDSAPATPGQSSVSVRLSESGLSISTTPVQTRRVQTTQATRTLRCTGGTLNLRGNGQRLNILGNCAAVNITGSRNVVSLERVGSISVQGSSNRITWKAALRGTKPLLRVSGAGNSVLSAARPLVQPKPALKPAPKPVQPSKTATRL